MRAVAVAADTFPDSAAITVAAVGAAAVVAVAVVVGASAAVDSPEPESTGSSKNW